LRGEISHWVIERSTRLAISRLELAAATTKEITEAVGGEVINEAMDETALEVQAQKEAEEAAANAENTVTSAITVSNLLISSQLIVRAREPRNLFCAV
uniref:PHB domain-containing protein n=1 Tax=Echinostoma caproni TaxID=27848 RepID=A0A183APR2_9TREM